MICVFPPGHSDVTETRYYSLDAAKEACNKLDTCEKIWNQFNWGQNEYYLCPPGSTTDFTHSKYKDKVYHKGTIF